MPCPVDTTLQFAKICGSVQEICPTDEPQNLRVTIDLVNPSGSTLKDPTTDAFVVGGRIFDDLIVDSVDGCWCTCDLLVNTAADPAQSIQPNNTAYKITVRWGTLTVIDGLQFQLDADTIGNFTLDNNAECGDCINISDLIEIPVLPPAATFCDQVDACVVDLQAQADGNTAAIAAIVDSDTVSVVTDNGDGTWTHDDGTGNTVVITDTDTFGTAVDNGDGTSTITFPDGTTAVTGAGTGNTSVVTNNGNGTWTHDDGTGTTTTISTGTVTDNGDGTFTIAFPDGTTATSDANTDTFGTAVDNGDGTTTATFPDGTTITTITDTDTDTFGALVDNGDGTYTWAPAGGGAGFTIDVNEVIVSTDAGNLIVAGGDDGAFISCEIVQDCVGAALGALDGITYDDAGNAITVNIVDADGNPLTPTADGVYQLPASTGNDTSVLTDNGDGTWTHDDGTGTTVTIDTGTVASPAADGSVTATFPNGDTITTVPDVGQAVVTDNTDNTTTITGTDAAGTVTTDTVINDLLVNNGDVGTSRSIDPDVDILLHDGNVQASADFATDFPNDDIAVDAVDVYKNTAGALRVPAAGCATVPDAAFADLCAPTQAEVETWVAANGPWIPGTNFVGDTIPLHSVIDGAGGVCCGYPPTVEFACGWQAPTLSPTSGYTSIQNADGSIETTGPLGMAILTESTEALTIAGSGRPQLTPNVGTGYVRVTVLSHPVYPHAGDCPPIYATRIRLNDIDAIDSVWQITQSNTGNQGCRLVPWGPSNGYYTNDAADWDGEWPRTQVVIQDNDNAQIGMQGPSLGVNDWVQFNWDYTGAAAGDLMTIIPNFGVYEPVRTCLGKAGAVIESLDAAGNPAVVAFTEADC